MAKRWPDSRRADMRRRIGVRCPKSLKPETCTERCGVDPTGISVKVGTQYPGRSDSVPRRYQKFTDTNNLSLVVFIKYRNFKILFPGDLEKPGWTALQQQPAFCAELVGTDVLVASHHGRENGFCKDIFAYFTPRCVVISDKAKVHSTQEMVPDYRAVVHEKGARVRSTMNDRHVLTTRRDGWIQFTVDDNDFYIDTEYNG